MFWDTKDPPSHNIEILLESPDTKVEVFLDEDNIIQECKTQKKNIVNYFTRPDVIRRLIELITTEPPEDVPMSERFRHANVACEILTMGLPSLDEKLLADTDTLNMLYSYLENEPPLNPLLASFFSKTFSMLFTKKSDQDWFLYQQTCLKLLEYLKTKSNFLDLICKHFTTPIVPDLIMEMMRNVEGAQLKRSLFQWLNDERLVEKLIEINGDPEQSEKHANVADFLCDLIHQGRTMRQEVDNFEPVFEGSNPILKNIESATTLFALFNVILQPNAIESAIVSGITVVLKIIKPVKVTDDRNAERMLFFQDREKVVHDEFLTTVIRVIEPQLKQFNELLKNPPKKPDILTSAANLSPPFGMTRLQICRLFTVLLQTKNEEISKAICETDFLDILLTLFKEYCWNNFLHSEVEKSLQTIFSTSVQTANTNNNSTHVSDGSKDNNKDTKLADELAADIKFNLNTILSEEGEAANKTATSPTTTDSTPSAIQTHAIVNCKIISKLIECWKANKEIESAEKGRRLGYMGHLINIFKHITNCISESEYIGALIENNLKDENERELWQSIVNTTDGDLTKALSTQNKLLANHEPCDYNVSLDFFTDNNISDAFNGLCTLMDSSDAFGSTNDDEEGDEDDNAAATFEGDGGLSFLVDPPVNPFMEDPWNAVVNDMMSEIFDMKKKPDGGGGFANFEAYFGMNNDTTSQNNPTEAKDSNLGKTTETTSSEEYDNNANVEKSSSWSADFSSFQIPKKDTTQYTSNFVDDYEDDEGMWTKPLGGSSDSTVEQSSSEQESVEPTNRTDEESKTNSLTNGPCSSQENILVPENQADKEETSLNQLNNSLEDNTLIEQNNEDNNITTTTSTINENKDDSAKELNNDLKLKSEVQEEGQQTEEETTSKHKSLDTETNNVTTTNNTKATSAKEVSDGPTNTANTT